ncbi:hypothetical protein GCM10011374_24730 [Kocuria dechangensis]|uniref:Uncharacterized protein n=1 Tax=Kocuria dechangensis TaxID=1176249 RepID=A0A917GY03_9MICC|nr:hypothetical protein GCM10011374_24730 [Kocuria dechangensis]
MLRTRTDDRGAVRHRRDALPPVFAGGEKYPGPAPPGAAGIPGAIAGHRGGAPRKRRSPKQFRVCVPKTPHRHFVAAAAPEHMQFTAAAAPETTKEGTGGPVPPSIAPAIDAR